MKPLNKYDFYIANANDWQEGSPLCASASKPTIIVIHPDCTPEEAQQYINKIMEWQKANIKLVAKTIAVEEI